MKRNAKWVPNEGGVRGTWRSIQDDGSGGGVGLVDGDYGDITVGGTGTTMAIDNNAVTNAKLAQATGPVLKGRLTASLGAVSDLTATEAGQVVAQRGTWTPVLTFDTPGNLSVAYAANGQLGEYVRIGNLIIASFNVNTSTFTHTTAAGVMKLTGLPVASSNIPFQPGGTLSEWQGITKANYTHVSVRVRAETSELLFLASGSGQTTGGVQPADTPSGGTMLFRGTVMYYV